MTKKYLVSSLLLLLSISGGIVFNSTPGVKSVWGMEWQ